ncbi:MAG: helicase-associated domain-containing protein [Anaerolineales bacterium]|nr:helicase-associated domain-containing protein [Anaerolineales bacterium]MCX7755089.1 helicase-associated domain-containing protein [Anaerolineales bacterium]MDW8277558.1 helicase-associated domain-containing protein [Anaerolineales bacterium]
MPSLAQTLPANDLGFLRIAASLWGIELTSNAPAQAALELAEAMLDAELMEEVLATLPDAAREALAALFGAGGRLPWPQFARRFGDLREMGPARRDREQPYARPNSAAETLYYRALIGKAFFDTPNGPQEFAFIPDDLLQALEFIGFAPDEAPAVPPPARQLAAPPAPKYTAPKEPRYAALDEPEYADIDSLLSDQESNTVVVPAVSAKLPPVITPGAGRTRESSPLTASAGNKDSPPGRAATPSEKAHLRPASDYILDDLTTLLAALRSGIEPPAMAIPLAVLTGLASASGLVSGNTLQPEAIRTFLEAPRETALAALVEAWQTSETFNELRLMPGLVFEGVWENQPLVTREFLLNLLEPIPEGVWWSLSSFIRDVKQRYPDFQRPAGDYDTWFIKRASDGQYLRGFGAWDEVDGALIRFFFQILHWLGQIDLAAPDETAAPTAFRILNGELRETKHENARPVLASNGLLVIPRLAPRSLRYQAARFCEWLASPNSEEYRYRISAASLRRAAAQGLKPGHLLGLLAKHTAGQVPPVLVKALQRWEARGTEARIETLTVLKVSRPDVLAELRASKAARFLGEVIGPTAVVIQRGAEASVLTALAELGLLAEVDSSADSPSS